MPFSPERAAGGMVVLPGSLLWLLRGAGKASTGLLAKFVELALCANAGGIVDAMRSVANAIREYIDLSFAPVPWLRSLGLRHAGQRGARSIVPDYPRRGVVNARSIWSFK